MMNTNQTQAKPRTRKAYGTSIPIWMIAAFTAAIIGGAWWTTATELATTVRATGAVAPIGANKRAMHAEGGVVTELLAHIGDKVEAGQILARINPIQAEAQRGEQQARLTALRARAARLTAEIEGGDAIAFPPEARDDTRRVEQSLFAERRALVSAQIASLEAERAQYAATIVAQQAQLDGTRAQLEVLHELVGLHDAAAAKGAGSAGQRMEAKEREASVRSQALALPGQIEASKASIKRIESKMDEVRSTARAEAQTLLSTTLADASAIDSAVRASDDRVVRSEVRSPVSGEIQTLNIAAVGEVVQPGQVIAEVVPVGDKAIIEAQVDPKQIRSVTAGMPTLVRLDAFDVSRYGTLTGRVISVSPSTDKDSRTGTAYYKVRVETDNSDIAGKPIRIGSTATIDVLTGNRLLATYMTDRAINLSLNAFRETR